MSDVFSAALVARVVTAFPLLVEGFSLAASVIAAVTAIAVFTGIIKSKQEDGEHLGLEESDQIEIKVKEGSGFSQAQNVLSKDEL